MCLYYRWRHRESAVASRRILLGGYCAQVVLIWIAVLGNMGGTTL